MDRSLLTNNNYMQPLFENRQIDNSHMDSWPVLVSIPLYNENINIKAQKGILMSWCITANNKKEFYKNILDDTPFDKKLEEYGKSHNVSTRLKTSEGIIPAALYKFTFPYSSINKSLSFLKINHILSGKIFPGIKGIVEELAEDKALQDILKMPVERFQVKRG